MQTKHNMAPTEESPLVSFIIPVYNVPADMLTACVESILSLTLRPYEREIIVVDDGSDTSALPALSRHADSLLYVRQPNQGVSTARNTGLRMARGRYVQFVDGDDMLMQYPYEHVLDFIRYREPDMVMFDFSTTPTPPLTYQDAEPKSGAELMRNNNIHGSAWGYIFSRIMVGTLQFRRGVAYGEDEEFTAQLLLRTEQVYVTSAKASYYRERPTSAIRTPDMRHRLQRLNDMKGVILHLQAKTDTLPSDERIALERRVAQLTMDYIYNIIVLTGSRHYLDRRIGELRAKGMFPLPDRHYTTKYTWFRRMTNSEVGLRMLMRLLPLAKKER